jgi:hypothetical protein
LNQRLQNCRGGGCDDANSHCNKRRASKNRSIKKQLRESEATRGGARAWFWDIETPVMLGRERGATSASVARAKAMWGLKLSLRGLRVSPPLRAMAPSRRSPTRGSIAGAPPSRRQTVGVIVVLRRHRSSRGGGVTEVRETRQGRSNQPSRRGWRSEPARSSRRGCDNKNRAAQPKARWRLARGRPQRQGRGGK